MGICKTIKRLLYRSALDVPILITQVQNVPLIFILECLKVVLWFLLTSRAGELSKTCVDCVTSAACLEL